jgi:hypothetical protein
LLLEAVAFAHGVIDVAPDSAASDPLVRADLVFTQFDESRAVAAADAIAARSPVLAARLQMQYAAGTQADPAQKPRPCSSAHER